MTLAVAALAFPAYFLTSQAICSEQPKPSVRQHEEVRPHACYGDYSLGDLADLFLVSCATVCRTLKPQQTAA